MENTIRQLETSGEQLAETVLAEVRYTYNSMLGQTTGEFSCRSDFIARRLQQRIQAIGHEIDPDRFPEPEIVPVICSTNPSDYIDLGTTLVTFYGYDLLEFEQTQGFNVALQYADTGETVRQQAGYVSQAHNYQLIVDLQSPALKNDMSAMDRDRGPQIVLRWGTLAVQDDWGTLSVLPIILPEPEATPPPYTEVGVTTEFGGPFGDWGLREMCPVNTWVMGAALRIESDQGGGGDDTALNSIRLVCGTHSDAGYVTDITSSTGFWGEWDDLGRCGDEHYISGARLRIEPRQGSGDDTGAVDAEFLCSDGRTLTGQTHHAWGEWMDIRTCPADSAICGLETRVESRQGSGDDTAFNDVRFYCCTLP
jgi:hypothetical protein